MSESQSGKIDELMSRFKDMAGNIEGQVDDDTVLARIRETIRKAGTDIEAEAMVARVKDVVGQAEGRVDADKLRLWIDEVDRDKLRSWLDEAKTLGAGAASLVEAQGEKLADRAPGAFDKLAGAVREKLDAIASDERLITKERIERLKGQIKESIASVTEMVESKQQDAADAAEPKVDKGSGRG